jgi:CRP-like cAMP-binding protein
VSRHFSSKGLKRLHELDPSPLKAGSMIANPPQSALRVDQAGKPTRNVLLSSISEDEYRLISPLLEPVDLPRYLILNDPGERIDFGYFPNEGMTSIVVVTHDGESVEVGLVGREGMIGASVIAGIRRAAFRAIMQIPGEGMRINIDRLEELLPSLPDFRQRANHFVLLQSLQVAQIAACNRLHEVEQRLARWLLMCQDRVDSPVLPLTHEFLAQMLGAGRPTVSLACARLEEAGLITNTRGALRVVNRKALEDATCECYGAIRHFNGGLGLQPIL